MAATQADDHPLVVFTDTDEAGVDVGASLLEKAGFRVWVADCHTEEDVIQAGRGGEVVGHDPHVPASEWPEGVPRLELGELLSRSLLVSLHLPLSDETRHLIGPEQLSAMPRGGYLVNVSRGGIVDERALLDALE